MSLSVLALLIGLGLGGLIGLFWNKPSTARRWFYGTLLGGLTALSLWITSTFLSDPQLISVSLGNWIMPYGIALIADPFSMAMVTLSLIVTTTSVWFMFSSDKTTEERPYLLPLLFYLNLGIVLSFLTNDFFNLFVAFEIMLISSYGLLFQQKTVSLNAVFLYIKINILGGLIFLTSTGVFYALTGTLNMAQAGEMIALSNDLHFLPLVSIVLFVFCLKGGIFPLYYWLPQTYPALPTPVLSVFGSMLTKVGIYALVRVCTLVFPVYIDQIQPLIWSLALPTMLIGVISAVSRTRLMEVLSLHIVSQIGFMFVAISFFSELSLKATIFYMVHHILVTASLFMIAGIAIQYCKTDTLKEMGGLWKIDPLLSALFLLQALSLAGLPPFSGFWGKLMIFKLGVLHQDWIMISVLVLSGLLTILSMVKVLYYTFWNAEQTPVTLRPIAVRGQRTIAMGLVSLSLLIGLYPTPLLRLSEIGAQFLTNPSAYMQTISEVGDKP